MLLRDTQVRVAPDGEAWAEEGAGLLAELTARARDPFLLALAGGRTPLPLYRCLAASPYRERIPWGRLLCFWSDERCVPPEDPRSNYGAAWKHLFSKVKEGRLFPPPTDGEPARAALIYEQTLKEVAGPDPRLDLILLGIGEDGHTASLFPGDPALEEGRRLVVSVPSPGDVPWRLTFTLPLINRARCVLFLVTGANKARVVRRVLEGDGSLPAGRVRPVSGRIIFFLDRSAAALLPRRDGS